MSKVLTASTIKLIDKFHSKAIDAKLHAERGTATMNEIYEGLMSEIIELDRNLAEVKAALIDRDEELGEQLDLILNLRETIEKSK